MNANLLTVGPLLADGRIAVQAMLPSSGIRLQNEGVGICEQSP
ncbi:MAG: hypothetical protein ACPGSB_09875 [Opitutales bacterium]